jgi:dienelactone hydrolase
MRNALPLVGLGCFTVIILGMIVGGIVMISHGVGDFFDKQEKQASPPPVQQPPPGVRPDPKETESLSQARTGFATTLIGDNLRNGMNIPVVPQATTVAYQSQGNNLSALLSASAKKGPKQPLVVWVHDGFAGVTSADWEKAKHFRDAGCAVMIPAFRAENMNKGEFEMFYGEVDDLFAAIEYAANQPGVDANRVYVVGHGTGGTLTLLAAVSGKQKPAVRAYFAIGGTPYLQESLKAPGSMFANVSPPFDLSIRDETRLRSALPFAGSIRQPTFFFGASTVDPAGCNQASRMEIIANANRKQPSFRAVLIPNATREKFEAALVELIAGKIRDDRPGRITEIRFDPAEVNSLFIKK